MIKYRQPVQQKYQVSNREADLSERSRLEIFHALYVAEDPQLETALGLSTRVGTLIVATINLQLIQNRYMLLSVDTVLQCSHQHCVQPVASDVEVVGYL